MKKNYIKNITMAIVIIVGLIVFIYATFFFVTLRTRLKYNAFHEKEIDAFVGCPGRDNGEQTYETMTQQQIDETLKLLNLNRKEFEKRKNECIKSQQLRSFAGCKGERHTWKRWDEMGEDEIMKTLDYFNYSEEEFDYLKSDCEK